MKGSQVFYPRGGAFIQEANRQAISSLGVSLWLDVEIDLLWSRVKTKIQASPQISKSFSNFKNASP